MLKFEKVKHLKNIAHMILDVLFFFDKLVQTIIKRKQNATRVH